jgi:hypothetical protein
MQTRSFSKAFRKTIVRMWWVPFLFAAIIGPVVYTQNEIQGSGFVTTGRVLLAMPDGAMPEESVVMEHVIMLESAARLNKAKVAVAELHPEAEFMIISINAECAKGTNIINVTGTGTDADLVRELLRVQMQFYMATIDFLKKNPSPEVAALDLGNVTPQVQDWPGPAMESNTHGVLSGLLASLVGAVYGIVFMLVVSGLWAFFRPAWVQPSLEEIMKAADGLDPTARTVLLELLEGGASGEAGSRGAA